MDSTDDDDLFATLGGSLMKDLLADLNDDADAGLLSLEQLEKELAHLDSKPYSSLPTVSEETPSAASMVVSAQHTQGSLYGNTVGAVDSGMDAWSISLQKFTAASLEEDFLQADSARKALNAAPVAAATTPLAPPGLAQLLSKAEEYDVGEGLVVRPPPGLSSGSIKKSVLEEVAEKLESTAMMERAEDSIDELPPPPLPSRLLPITPQNSMAFDLPKPAPPTPQNSVTVTADGTVLTRAEAIAQPPPPSSSTLPPAPAPLETMHISEQPGIPPTPPNSLHAPSFIPPGRPMAGPLLGPLPVATPIPQAWGGGPRSPMPMAMPPPPTRPVYANPHPDAPPIPAHALATPFMTMRDISYVVHSILKPILALGTSPFDYDQVFLRRRGQGLRPGKQPQGVKSEEEMKSRGEKAKEWSDQHSTLGKSAKTNVARPRALIAQPVTAEGTPGGEEKQRQTLWKARIYCDQAYQAYMQVVEAWEKSPGSAVPANLQPHLVKLLRCLGITLKDDKENPSYAIDPAALSLLLKLSKGRVLLSRLLEQALLPPASVQVLLPQALNVLYEYKPDSVDDRVFAAWSRVINSLPDLKGVCILDSTTVIKGNTTAALQSTNRMQTVHALLRRGSMLAAANADFAKDWSIMETEFMKILGGM